MFPGGAIDEDDASPVWDGRLPDTTEKAACAAALRELFEETGILPNHPGSNTLSAELEVARRELLEDRRRFSGIAEHFDLDFSAVPLAYFSRWITPRTLATRFDTRFFLLASEHDTVEVTLTREHVSALWETPRRALERYSADELPMLFPTRKTLERLTSFETLESAFEALREIHVQPTLAKLDLRGGQIRPLMPGDPGYDETY